MTDHLFPVADEEFAALHSRLAQTADARGMVEVAFRFHETPVGTVLLASTNRGLVRVAFERENFSSVLATLAERLGSRVLELPNRLDFAVVELDEYFARQRRSFSVPLDFSLSSGFRQTVQQYLPRIDYGQTESYRSVADHVGSPRAVRAVGTACATNPLPIVVPCHRVLRSDGALGGYLGGLDAKSTLLRLEGAT